jgi:ABC-type branched-subunit amino acid transport system substrate-binding protein
MIARGAGAPGAAGLVVVAVLGAALAGCPAGRSSGAASGQMEFFGDTHVAERDGEQGAERSATSRDLSSDLSRDLSRDLTLAEAEAALVRALSGEAHADVIRLASRVVSAGGALDADAQRGVMAAVDALPAAALTTLYGELDAAAMPAPLLALRIALVAEHTGDDAAARRWLERASGAAAVDGALGDRTRALEQRMAARARVDPAVIVVLLPRTGRFARLGGALEAGIRFAARTEGRGVKLHVLDTAGDEGRAAAAVDRAVFEHRAVAILGPVGEREARRAAARAAELGVPIALLSPGEDGGSPDAGVFRLWTSPRWEAAEAARLALSMGHERLAVLAPRDEHGTLATEAFVRAAHAAGARVVAAGQYDPTAGSLEPDIKAFLGLDPATNERLRDHLRRHGRKGWKTFSPDVPFDLLYIPDEHERAALVAAYLPYFNVELRSPESADADVEMLRRKHRGRVPRMVQLMGSSGWHHAGVIPRGGSAVEGALVIDVCAGGSGEEWASEEGTRFAAGYESFAGHAPGGLAAQAYDAALLVFEARARAAGKGRGSVRSRLVRALAGARLDGGACGVARVDPTGQIEREAVVLRIEGGAFVVHEY